MVAIPLGMVPVGCVMVVVAADILGGDAGVIVMGGARVVGLVEMDVVPDPSAGVSLGWSTSMGLIGLRVGPTPSPSGTGLMVYHLLASSTAMYTQRRSSSMKWIGLYSLSLCE